jgi:hypothetical protein
MSSDKERLADYRAQIEAKLQEQYDDLQLAIDSKCDNHEIAVEATEYTLIKKKLDEIDGIFEKLEKIQ